MKIILNVPSLCIFVLVSGSVDDNESVFKLPRTPTDYNNIISIVL